MALKYAQKLSFNFAASTLEKGLLYQTIVLKSFFIAINLATCFAKSYSKQKEILVIYSSLSNFQRDMEHIEIS